MLRILDIQRNLHCQWRWMPSVAGRSRINKELIEYNDKNCPTRLYTRILRYTLYIHIYISLLALDKSHKILWCALFTRLSEDQIVRRNGNQRTRRRKEKWCLSYHLPFILYTHSPCCNQFEQLLRRLLPQCSVCHHCANAVIAPMCHWMPPGVAEFTKTKKR